MFVCISGLLISLDALVTEVDGADDDGIGERGAMGGSSGYRFIFCIARADCVIGAFIGLVICVKLVLFGSLDNIGLLMTGDNDGLPVLSTLLIMW